jgi:hypothetical protein
MPLSDGAKSILRGALVLLTAVVTAALLARAAWSRLSAELSVRTDIVGYPTAANFNIERYFQRYWLLVAFVPLVTLGLFLLIDRIVPGRRPRPSRTSTTNRARSGSATGLRWAIAGRVALVGALLGLELAILIRREPDWIWAVGLPTVVFYSALIAGLGRWLDVLPGKDAWERSATGNALATPLLILGLYGAAQGTKVVGPGREWSYRWLPVWLAVSLAVAVLAWIAAQMSRGVAPPAIDRSVALAIAGPVAIFLSTSVLQGALGPMDMFHDGESLAAAELVRDGAFPWRDLLFIHGLLVDVLTPLVGMTIFEDSRWGISAGGSVLLAPLYWVAIYAFCAYVFRTNWLFLLASQLVVFATVAGVGPSELDFLFGPELRFLLLPLALVGLIALLRRATPARAAFFAGITLFQTILSPEAAIAGVIFFLAVVGYEALGFERRVPLRQIFARTGLTIAFGSALLAVWCAFLAWHGALGDFFSVYLTFASSHELTGGIPLQPTGTEFWLALYVPPAAALLMLGLVVTLVIRRRNVSPEDWAVAAMALFVLAYHHKSLVRPDDAHVFQVAGASLPLVLYMAFRFIDAGDRLLAGLELPDRDLDVPQRATIAALVLLAIVNASLIGQTLESLPTRLEATTGSAPELKGVGFATTDAVDTTMVRDLGEIDRFYLDPGDTVFDFSNSPALFHYLLDLKPATRYYHVSLAIRRKSQLDLIDELEQSKPKLVFYPGSVGPVGLPTWDGVSNAIRHYEVSEWILRRYRPIGASHGFVVMVPKSAPAPTLTALHDRLVKPPRTDRLYERGPSCNWGYAPNFLTPAPETDATPLTIEPPSDPFVIRGWAVDLAARKPVKLVLVANGQRIIGTAKPSSDRPDVQRSFGDKDVRMSGYQVEFPRRRIAMRTGGPDLSNLRVYGLLADGRALELPYGAFTGWRPTSPRPDQLIHGDRRFQIGEEGAQGAVDDSSAGVVSVRVPSFARYGWLEIESSRPLPADAFKVNAEDNPGEPLTFSTLGRGERRVRVRAGACSQWYGYRGKRLLIRSRVDPGITAVRLYR